jgi:AAA domain, putative AbiEii toxin, Type IV TA system
MLEWLKLENVGPAPKFELDFAPRVNLITGDNGLGKSFLLDVAWFALTGVWLGSLNPRVGIGQALHPPAAETKTPKISYRIKTSPYKGVGIPTSTRNFTFSFSEQNWSDHSLPISQDDRTTQALLLYVGIDGELGIHDPTRGSYAFSTTEVWNGLARSVPVWDRAEPNTKVVCNGLIRDWATWQLENGDSFKQLKAALKVLSPHAHEILELGKLTRVSLDDARDIPTLKMPYGQEVPIIYASAGIRRVVSLAYLMVWAWQEHLRAAQLTRRKPTQEMVILIDELEEHLHPRWQRVILPALLAVAKTIMAGSDVRVQIIAATHSPMVMASLEPLFDAEQDAWFDLNLVDGEVTLEKMLWRKHGDANAWLQSEAFDLPSTGSVQAGEVKARAGAALQNAKLSKKKFLELDAELRETLAETDSFLLRWHFWGEKKGWV